VVLDHGSGNVRSVVRALERAGADAVLTADPDAAARAAGLVVPGVGAFAACMDGLVAVDGGTVIARRVAEQRPVLGICVGMQVMFEHGVEHGVDTRGLGLWAGVVERLTAPVVPHMGWSTVEPWADSVLFRGIADHRFYFVHSYAVLHWQPAATAPRVARPTWAEHGDRFVAAVEDGALAATQFHPEKSGAAGQRLLSNWLETL
jgi:glutamine amidotransferase